MSSLDGLFKKIPQLWECKPSKKLVAIRASRGYNNRTKQIRRMRRPNNGRR